MVCIYFICGFISTADKGRSTVLLDKLDYEKKIESMLTAGDTYKRLSRDPAPALERRVNSFLLTLKKSGVLPNSLYYRIRSSARKTPQFYGLPKIHKLGIPLRPIVSFINSPTYELSKHLVTLLSPLVGKTSSHTANSFEFASFVTKQKLPEGTTWYHLMWYPCSQRSQWTELRTLHMNACRMTKP